jgi:hypothetical protein
MFRGSISFGACSALIFCPGDMVVEELSVQLALEVAGKADCSVALCFVFERACGVRRKRSELYVVVRWVCGINWQGTVSIANFDIKGFLAFVFTHLRLLFLIVIQPSVFVAGANPSCHSVSEALSSGYPPMSAADLCRGLYFNSIS